MIKKYIKLFIIIIICLTITSIYKIYESYYAVGRIDNVKKIIENNDNHKREDIESVMQLIAKEFNTKDYKGCTLEKITYTSDYSFSNNKVGEKPILKSKEEYLKEEYAADEVMMFSIEYKRNMFSTQGPSNNVPSNIVYILKDGKWKLATWGLE